MSVPVRRRGPAEQELLAYIDRIAEENLEAALRLIDAFEAACAHFSNHPEIAPLHETEDPRLKDLGIRRWVLPEFPNYLVFYRFDGVVIEILHFMHAKLDHDRRL